MATYNVFRAENRSNGHEEHIGTVNADSTEQAAMEANGQYECDNLHHLTVAPRVARIEYSVDSLGDFSASEFQAACETVAESLGMQCEFVEGLHNREFIDGEEVDDSEVVPVSEMAFKHLMNKTAEIASILQSAGPAFDGGTDADRARISREWDEDFEPAAVRLWVAAGCWDAATAVDLDDAGFSPTADKLRFTDGRDGDAMHELCDGDVTIDDVTW